jgi:hypothetical protein
VIILSGRIYLVIILAQLVRQKKFGDYTDYFSDRYILAKALEIFGDYLIPGFIITAVKYIW